MAKAPSSEVAGSEDQTQLENDAQAVEEQDVIAGDDIEQAASDALDTSESLVDAPQQNHEHVTEVDMVVTAESTADKAEVTTSQTETEQEAVPSAEAEIVVPPSMPEKPKSSRVPVILGVLASLGWATAVGTSLFQSGMPTLTDSFSLIPWEYAAFAAGVSLPLTLIWLIVAYMDRGKRFENEVAELRTLMHQMAYPSGAYEERIKSISNSLRAQAQDLNDASLRAAQQVDAVRVSLQRHTDDLTSTSTRIETDTAHATNKRIWIGF